MYLWYAPEHRGLIGRGVSVLGKLGLTLLLCSWQSSLKAGVVGSFDGVRNLPGYISLQRGDDAYRDLVKRPRRRGDALEQRGASRILKEDYLRDDGTIDIAALDAKIIAIKEHENVAFLTYCVARLPHEAVQHVEWCQSRADEKIKKKWRRSKLAAIYAFALSELHKARQCAAGVRSDNINQASSQNFLEHLFQGLETFASIIDTDPINSDFFNAIMHGIDFSKVRVGFAVEAANLVIPVAMKEKYSELQKQVFFSPRQLQRLAPREGLDISAIDPLDSGFWRKPHSIRAFNTSNYNGQSGLPDDVADVHKEIAVTYDWDGKFTGRTPKMRVRYRDEQYKMKYLSEAMDIEHADALSKIHMHWRKHASEVNTETVVNNIAAALGFTVDPTFFKHSVRLYLPLQDPTSQEEFDRAYQRLLADHRRWSGYTPDRALARIARDERGYWFIRMRSVSLERRSQVGTDLNVGGFIKAAFSRPLKREFRAFALFLAWFSDLDVKDDNASIVLVGDADGRKVAYSAADMGAVLGSWMGKDSPNFLNRDLVSRVRRKPDGSIYEIVLNYISPFGNSSLNVISISDGKWITRLIAQLSPTQIKKAFLTAGYSELLSEYYTQLMLRRRDQLVEVFGLMGHTITDAAGTNIFLKPESKMTDPDTYAVEGYEQYFKDGYLHDPEGEVSDNPGDFVRRYYDRNLVHATPGTLQNALWKTVEAWLKISTVSMTSQRLHKLKITNRTFGLPLLRGGFCARECFYDGLRIGITNFLPQRFLLRNPYDTKEKPLLVVDVYRFGFLLGADVGEDLPARFGIDAPLDDRMPQLRYQKVYEFVKVKPLSTIVDSVKTLQELSPLQVLKYGRIHQQLIEQLQPGESLIASTYLSRGAGVQLGKYPFLSRPMVNAEIDLSHIVVSRKALIRSADKFLFQFSDLKASKFKAEIGGELLLTDFPLLSWKMEKLAQMDRVFALPAAGEHYSLLEENLAARLPSDDIADFAVIARAVARVKNQFSLILKPAKFFLSDTDIATIKTDGSAGAAELHIATVTEKKKFRYLPFYSSHNTTLESFVTQDEQVFVRLRMKFKNLFGKREHFKWVYQHMLPLLGRPFILFTPEDVNYYLDDFEFAGEVYLLPEGVEKIMAYRQVTKQEFCVAYANAAGKLNPQRWCEKLFADELGTFTGRGRMRSYDERRFRSFFGRYLEATHSWLRQPTGDMSEEERDQLWRDKARTIARMLSVDGFNAAVWKMWQRIAGEENIYRDGILTSRTGGFPSQSKIVAMPASVRGRAGERVAEVYRNIVQSVQISTDPLFSELSQVFYEPMGEGYFSDR